MEFSRQESQSGLPFSTPGAVPNPETESASPAFRVDSLPLAPHVPGAVKFRETERECRGL